MSEPDFSTHRLFLISLLGVAVLLNATLGMMVYYYATAQRLDEERTIRAPYEETERALSEQRARLRGYEKLGELAAGGNTGPVYRIPIDEAMQRVLADWNSGALPGPVVETPAVSNPMPAGKPAPAAASPAIPPAGERNVRDGEVQENGRNG